MTPALIQSSVTIGFAILLTAGLSFVGAGVRPPTPEWGLMMAEYRNLLTTQPMAVFGPGLMLATLFSSSLAIWALMNHLQPFKACRTGPLDNSRWLEDRVVKRFFQAASGEEPNSNRYAPAKAGTTARFELVTRKAVGPDEQELEENPRARSAKLRVAIRTEFTPAPTPRAG